MLSAPVVRVCRYFTGHHNKLPNVLPFSGGSRTDERAYHGREELRAQPAASRREPTFARAAQATSRCNGLLDASPPDGPRRKSQGDYAGRHPEPFTTANRRDGASAQRG
jgi:hypothetical protein